MTKRSEIDMGDLLLEGPELAETEMGSVVKVCAVVTPADPSQRQWMRLQETSGAFDFWDRDEEDIYSPEDGEPV